MTNEAVRDEKWAGLAALAEASRQPLMEARFREVLTLDAETRVQQLEGMVRAEYSLDDTVLPSFTLSRLRAWIAIAENDVEDAQALAQGYDAAFDRLPANLAMRRSSLVQQVAREHLSPAEVERLFTVIPSLARHVPRALEAMHPREPERSRDKPWWKFW